MSCLPFLSNNRSDALLDADAKASEDDAKYTEKKSDLSSPPIVNVTEISKPPSVSGNATISTPLPLAATSPQLHGANLCEESSLVYSPHSVGEAQATAIKGGEGEGDDDQRPRTGDDVGDRQHAQGEVEEELRDDRRRLLQAGAEGGAKAAENNLQGGQVAASDEGSRSYGAAPTSLPAVTALEDGGGGGGSCRPQSMTPMPLACLNRPRASRAASSRPTPGRRSRLLTILSRTWKALARRSITTNSDVKKGGINTQTSIASATLRRTLTITSTARSKSTFARSSIVNRERRDCRSELVHL